MTLIRLLPRFRRAADEMETLAYRERWARADLEAFQLDRLNPIWSEAILHVPWYRELHARAGTPDRFDSLDEYRATVPILSKEEVRARPEAFLSDRARKGGWHRTGGSTGAPMRNYWGVDGHREILRTRYRHMDHWGIDVFARTAYVWGHSASFAPGLTGRIDRVKGPLEDRLRNRLRLSAYDMGREAIRGHLRRLARFRPEVVYGYSSALHLLALEAEKSDLPLDSPRLFILTGEPTLPIHVDTIERVFSVPAAVEYGAIETGVMASEWPDGTVRVREDVVMVETLPREDGRWEIVPTVLVNPSFPLLRYGIEDVTDDPIDVPDRGFSILGNVAGRNNEYVRTRTGQCLHSARFDAFFEHLVPGELQRFRVRQRADGSLDVKVELKDSAAGFAGELVEARLRELIGGWPVSVEVVDRIPLTAAGKHRFVASELSVGGECRGSADRAPV